MSTTEKDQLDPATFTPGEREELDRLVELMVGADHPALVGREGFRVEIPDRILHLFIHLLKKMREGKPILLYREDETLTTQAAANYLGVSRPFLIGLLENEEIPFHKVGTHRRIAMADLKTYAKRRDQHRQEVLNKLSAEMEDSGFYDKAAGE